MIIYEDYIKLFRLNVRFRICIEDESCKILASVIISEKIQLVNPSNVWRQIVFYIITYIFSKYLYRIKIHSIRLNLSD